MTAVAQEKVSCKDVIKACDSAIAEKNKALELSDLSIKHLTDENGRLSQENEDLNTSNGKWYKNPIIMFVFGAAAGTLTYTLLRK